MTSDTNFRDHIDKDILVLMKYYILIISIRPMTIQAFNPCCMFHILMATSAVIGFTVAKKKKSNDYTLYY